VPDPRPRLKVRRTRGGASRPSVASRGVVRVDPDFADEFPDGDQTSTEVHATLVRVGDALLTEIERSIRETFGVPQPVMTTLAVIDGADGPLTPSEIADRLIVPAASMTSILDELESRGWVERTPNPADRRSVLIEITDLGRATADQLLPGIRAIEVDTLSGLTAKERATLLSLLDKVLTRAAEVAEAPPRTLEGRRHRPDRLV
jgi:DNA-binding MarR family transcriptional regulator